MTLVEKYRKRVLEAANERCSFDVLMGHGRIGADPLT